MTKTFTDHDLRKAFGMAVNNVNRSATSQGTSISDENTIRSIQEKLVTKVVGSTLICNDGTEAELVSPVPCMYWKCLAAADDTGVATLSNPIGALIVTSDEINYCLGLIGTSDEFEVRISIGSNEIRCNKDYININANHLVFNGLEYKNE